MKLARWKAAPVARQAYDCIKKEKKNLFSIPDLVFQSAWSGYFSFIYTEPCQDTDYSVILSDVEQLALAFKKKINCSVFSRVLLCNKDRRGQKSASSHYCCDEGPSQMDSIWHASMWSSNQYRETMQMETTGSFCSCGLCSSASDTVAVMSFSLFSYWVHLDIIVLENYSKITSWSQSGSSDTQN